MRVGAIIEARTNSSRLPNKVMMDLCGKPVIKRIFERLKKIKFLDEIIVATTDSKHDDEFCFMLKQQRIKFFRGSEDNVLKRVLDTAKKYKIDLILEVWGDCPLFDPEINSKLIKIFKENNYDFVGCNIEKNFPIGVDGMVFPTKILEQISKRKLTNNDLEHVSVYIYKNPRKFRIFNYSPSNKKLKRPEIRLTLDYFEDYLLIKKIYQHFIKKHNFTLEKIIDFLDQNPKIKNINSHIKQINPLSTYEKNI